MAQNKTGLKNVILAREARQKRASKTGFWHILEMNKKKIQFMIGHEKKSFEFDFWILKINISNRFRIKDCYLKAVIDFFPTDTFHLEC